MTSRLLICALLLGGLIGCAPIALVPPEKQVIGESYSVEPSVQWNQAKGPTTTVWTIDGFDLQELIFFPTLEKDDALLSIPGKDEKLPKFDPSMRANDIMEFLQDTYIAAGYQGVATANLRPANFGDLSGFRFELTTISEDGLKYKGTVLGALHDEKLDIIYYRGTEVYYYGRHEQEVEHIFSTIEVLS